MSVIKGFTVWGNQGKVTVAVRVAFSGEDCAQLGNDALHALAKAQAEATAQITERCGEPKEVD